MNAYQPVSIIVPAFNEGDNIAAVLAVLHQTPLQCEIIVVDDGSTDSTAQIVKAWQEKDQRIVLKSLPKNQGKGNAMFEGVSQAKYHYVLFVDADLKGLTPEHLQQLLSPVQKGQADMTIARFENGRFQTSLMHQLLPFLSGQRCMKTSTFYALFDRENKDWSVETAFNLHAWYFNYQVQYIPWQGVTHRMRPEKRRGLVGYVSHLKMWAQIATYVTTFLVRQLPPLALRQRLEETISRRPANKAMPKQSQ